MTTTVADKYYCGTHGPRLECDCEHPLLVHLCAHGKCHVEIYDKTAEFCERHFADEGFLARGGPANIVNNVDEFVFMNWSPGFKVVWWIMIVSWAATFGFGIYKAMS